MNITDTTELTPSHTQQLYALWNQEYASNISHPSIEAFNKYLQPLQDKRHWLLMDGNNIQGWLFLFTRDHAQWFAVIIDSSLHGHGYGTQLLNIAKSAASQLHGWAVDHNNYLKQDGSSYNSPLPFYLKNGFVTQPDQRLEIPSLSAVKILWTKQPHVTVS